MSLPDVGNIAMKILRRDSIGKSAPGADGPMFGVSLLSRDLAH